MKYPFFYKVNFNLIENGWQSFSVKSEFYKYFSPNDSDWRLSEVNKDFKVRKQKKIIFYQHMLY